MRDNMDNRTALITYALTADATNLVGALGMEREGVMRADGLLIFTWAIYLFLSSSPIDLSSNPTFKAILHHKDNRSRSHSRMSLQLLLPSPPLAPNLMSVASKPCLLLMTINCKAKKDPVSTTAASSSNSTLLETAAIAGGLISTPVIAWSLYTLKTTGCGLPPGPAGSVGALEGVSYLAVVGIVGWSIYTKAKTGSGLPNGPFGLLGAVEGLSYLSLLAIIVVFGLQIINTGSLPGPLPSDQCFG